jgi:hypothetical protein
MRRRFLSYAQSLAKEGITRRLVIVAVAAAGAVAAVRLNVKAQATCAVTTPSGDVAGADRGPSCAFLGIPFAMPPSGSAR